MSSQKRRYSMDVRAQRQAETRRRIAEATVGLHEEVGPARTTIAEIARRAGVQRLTVYNNFPEQYDLFAACSRHFLEAHPPPDPTAALAADDPAERVEGVLRGLYGWFRGTERMAANVRRDRERIPALDAVMSDTADAQAAALGEALALGFATRPSPALRAAIAVALDFWTWRRLAREGLDDRSAARLMAELVRVAAAPSSVDRGPPAAPLLRTRGR